MKTDMYSQVRESEFRVAIHQTHNCETEELEKVVRVVVSRSRGPAWEGDVHVFKLSGHSKAARCYAWPEALGDTATLIRAVLHSEKISSPEQAVRSVLRRRSQYPVKA
jgi:hypothetical protein